MKVQNIGIAAGIVIAATMAAPSAMATIYGEGEGFYYVAYTQVSEMPPAIQTMAVGPFAEEADCLAARQVDQDNGGTWAPFYGSGIQCDWVFHNEVGALHDAVGIANLPGSQGDNPLGQLDAATLRSISTLRRVHDLDAFESELKRMLAPRR